MSAALLLALLLGSGRAQAAHNWCEAAYPAMEQARVLDTLGTDGQSSTGRLHVVRWDLQRDVRARLDKPPVIALDRAQAAALLGPGDRLTTSDRVLLVRGGALAGGDADEARGVILQARYSAAARALLIEGYQLTSAEPSYRDR